MTQGRPWAAVVPLPLKSESVALSLWVSLAVAEDLNYDCGNLAADSYEWSARMGV